MPRVHEMIESKYLRQSDVPEDTIVTIRKFGKVNVAPEDQPAEEKWAVAFNEFKKPMVLNSTNIQLLEKIFGSDNTDDWMGKQVIVYVDPTVSFGGKIVGGLRIRANKQAAPATAKTGGKFDDMTDDIPF